MENVGAASSRPQRKNVTFSHRIPANSYNLPQRAGNARPYSIHGTLPDKYQFEIPQKEEII